MVGLGWSLESQRWEGVGPLLPERILKDISLLDSSQNQMRTQVGAERCILLPSGVMAAWLWAGNLLHVNPSWQNPWRAWVGHFPGNYV